MKITRWICILLLVSLLPACAQKQPDAPATSGVPAVTAAPEDADTTAPDPNDRSRVPDHVPDGVAFDGESLRLLYRTSDFIEKYDVVGTDNIGDYVTDGVWARNTKVEERFGITLDTVSTDSGALAEVSSAIKQIVMSGSNEYDYIISTGNTTIVNSLNNYLRNLADLPYADYTAPWWWDEVNRAVSLDGKTYNYIFGDMLIYCYIQTGVVYYNKTLYENAYGDPEEMYKTVMDGKWTIDRMMELTSGAYVDANGNGVEDAGDIFGAMKTQTQGEETPHFLTGFDIPMYYREDDGHLVIEFDQERAVTAIEKISRFFSNTTGVFHSDQTIDSGSAAYFAEDCAIFFPARLSRVLHETFRSMTSPYGILPYPKLDEAQSEYRSLIHNSCTNICIPKTVAEDRFTMIGAVLEALSAESWRSVMPLFLDTALKVKYSQDQMSGQVIDLVIAGVTKNTLEEYNSFSGGIFNSCLATLAKTGGTNFASTYKKALPAAQKTWDKAVAALNAN